MVDSKKKIYIYIYMFSGSVTFVVFICDVSVVGPDDIFDSCGL